MSEAQKPADPFEIVARAYGWTRGGDCGGFIFHLATWGSWKAAASWSGENDPDGPNDRPALYDTWRECVEAEQIGFPFSVEINYQTQSGGNTFRAVVLAVNEADAIDKANAKLRADRRRRVLKIDGGSVEPAGRKAGQDNRACREGWGLFESDSRGLEVQADSDSKIFCRDGVSHDDEAAEFVQAMAANGSLYHAAALARIVRQR
jgi:hypothetical protein